MKRHRRVLSAAAIAILMVPAIALAADPEPADSPLVFEWNARLRHEVDDDDAFARDANASTLRLGAGLRMRFGAGFTALFEGEGIASSDDAYNSGANGRTAYPATIDPEGVELNQPCSAGRANAPAPRSAASGCCSTTSAGSAMAVFARTSRPSTHSRAAGSSLPQ